jgi:hypothetical protein
VEQALRGAAHRAGPRRLAAWGAVRTDFERALADPVDPAIASAEIASELRRGADHVRVTVALTVTATDVADALPSHGTPSAPPPGMTLLAGS